MSTEQRTVKVRAAVMVGANGDWSAYGLNDVIDAVAMNEAAMNFQGDYDEPFGEYFITAEVPLPAPPAEVEGRVEG